VCLRSRGATDEQRELHASALHLAGHVRHLVEARGDEAAQADHVHAMRRGGLEDLLGGLLSDTIDLRQFRGRLFKQIGERREAGLGELAGRFLSDPKDLGDRRLPAGNCLGWKIKRLC
jgi:hypothetical protein